MAKQKTMPGAPTLSGRPLIMGLGLLYAFVQFTTLIKVLALHKLDNVQEPLAETLTDRLLAWAVGFLFIILIVKLTQALLAMKWHLNRVMLAHLALIFPVTLLWYFVFRYAGQISCILFFGCEDLGVQITLNDYMINIEKLSLVYLLAITVTYVYYYLLRDNEHQQRQTQMEFSILQARMKMLRAQLNPHFLFNTLNSIISLMDIDVKKAKNMVADLSDLLRSVLDRQDQQLVPLSSEIAFLRRYVDIEKIRFSDDLRVDWDVQPGLDNYPIPSLLMQPLVENAIHHGFSAQHLELRINIQIAQEGNRLIIKVQDDGQGFPESRAVQIFGQGKGLQNTRERLQTLYRDDFTFTVVNTHPGVCSEIQLPYPSENQTILMEHKPQEWLTAS